MAVRFPRLSNFTDLDALGIEPGVDVRLITHPSQLGDPDLVILQGTKATVADLDWLRGTGLDRAIAARAAAGTPVLVGRQRVPLIGRVSMDLITLDLRQAPDAKVGDRVVLWGPELPVEIVAAQSGTISYDLTCGMTRRVLFVEDEQ